MAHYADEDLLQCWQWLIQLHTSAKLYRDMHAEGPWRQADAGRKLDSDLESVGELLKKMKELRSEKQRIERIEAARAVRNRKE